MGDIPVLLWLPCQPLVRHYNLLLPTLVPSVSHYHTFPSNTRSQCRIYIYRVLQRTHIELSLLPALSMLSP